MLGIQLSQPKPTFEQRLAQEAHHVKEGAKTPPHGKERELLSLMARQLETAHQRVDIVSRTPATEVAESSPRRTPT